ncbi:RNA polymerase sigma factor [Limnoglobus roseus]|uniref:Sigma-70 family RNA polymerase sigma factor n=1 Tax=Limnoglobus roseus TaxID=2598579 RepID=A0A5C1A5J6_9BACT|nr:sigma-70 family RNA polymerase sigma factor [Limnoglobus roseus]QEL14419.1 sigma-70 family RNA polymerase sigma factor [Limnoglobus roseus]
MHTTSATLLERVKRLGDSEAWSRFVRLYTPVLYGWAKQMGLHHDDAVDLVQDVFAVLVQKLPEFEYESHKRFRGWLWTVTRRRWVERQRRAALPVDRGQDPDQVAAARSDTPEIDEKEFHAHFLRHIVPTFQGQFQESTWRAFWKHVVEGRPVPEVAAEEGLTVAAVYKAKLRVTAHLHKELGDVLM